jgi:hypothetical protein
MSFSVSNKMPSKDDYEEVTDDKEDDTVVQSSSDGVPYYKLKSPMRVNPKLNIDDNNLNKMAIVGGVKIQTPYEHNKNNGYDGRHMIMGGGVEQKPMVILNDSFKSLFLLKNLMLLLAFCRYGRHLGYVCGGIDSWLKCCTDSRAHWSWYSLVYVSFFFF